MAIALSNRNLHTLPMLPLEEIALSLGFEDQGCTTIFRYSIQSCSLNNAVTTNELLINNNWTQVNLASTHPNLGFLMPKEQIVTGEDFTEYGPHDGHFCPETYMDVPILTRGLISVKMSFQWKDQECDCFFSWYYPYRVVQNYSCLLENSRLSAARELDQPMHSQSANFGKFKLNSRNLAGIILHHSASSLGVIEELSCVIGLLGRSGLAATLGQHCP